jgi:hypothetical protein
MKNIKVTYLFSAFIVMALVFLVSVRLYPSWTESIPGTISLIVIVVAGVVALFANLRQAFEERQTQIVQPTKQDRINFQNLSKQMPDLLGEMKEDISRPEDKLCREFVVLLNRNMAFSSSKKRFFYFESEHPDLQNKIDLLRRFGFVERASFESDLIYFMQEWFVDLLKQYKPKR